jgi:ubiquinone/menaquinone biosynthesis C-methylase UbiE
VQGFFEAGAGAYDRLYLENSASGHVLRERARLALELLGEEAGDVLDAGMGSGWLCADLDRRGWTVSGIDVSGAMVAGAVSRLPHLEDRLRRGEITALPYGDASFDAVVATGVLEYVVPELPRALGELMRVLRPGGAAVLSFPNYGAPMVLWRAHVLYPLVRLAKQALPARRPAPPRMPSVSFEDFCRQVVAAGLAIEDVRPLGAQPLPRRVATYVELSRPRLTQALGVQRVLRARRGS